MIDKRTYFQYYFSLLKKKQIILFSFYPNEDYNAQIIKSFLFFFFYTSDMTINSLFFTDDTMHKIYIDSGKFNLNYQLPQIIYSFLISNGINFIIEFLSLSEDIIISIKVGNMNIYKTTKEKNILYEIKILFFFYYYFFIIINFWILYILFLLHISKYSITFNKRFLIKFWYFLIISNIYKFNTRYISNTCFK